MKKNKWTLANVISFLAAAIFGLICYLSLNFLTLGDFKQSLLGAVIISLIILALAWGASRLKQTSRNFKTAIIFEVVCLVLFAASAYLAVKPFSHVFTVFNHKEKIVRQLSSNIEQAETLFDHYETYARRREDTYKSTLKSVVAAKRVNPSEYKEYGFDNSRSDENQIATKMFTLHAKLFPSNYENENDSLPDKKGIKEAALQWLKGERATLNNDLDFAFGIIKTTNKTPEKLKDWKDQLVTLSQFRAEGETAKDFDFFLNFENVKSQLTAMTPPTTLSVILAVVGYLIILLPYFVAKRSTKFPGISMILGQKGKANNEL